MDNVVRQLCLGQEEIRYLNYNNDRRWDRIERFNVCLFVCERFLMYVFLFVYLTGRSVRRHTWVLLVPDLNKMLKPC